MANAGRSQDSPPGQTPATTPPAGRCQGTRRTPIRPNGAMANAGRSQDSPPGQAPATTPPGRQTPGQAQDTHQTKRCRGKRKALARTSARRSLDQAAPEQSQGTPPRQSQDTHRGQLPPNKPIRTSSARPSSAGANARHPTKAIARHPPGQAPAKQTHQDKQRQTKQRKVYKPKSPASMETGDFSCRDSELLVAVL